MEGILLKVNVYNEKKLLNYIILIEIIESVLGIN